MKLDLMSGSSSVNNPEHSIRLPDHDAEIVIEINDTKRVRVRFKNEICAKDYKTAQIHVDMKQVCNSLPETTPIHSVPHKDTPTVEILYESKGLHLLDAFCLPFKLEALAMGCHSRLGARSEIQNLPTEVLLLITKCAWLNCLQRTQPTGLECWRMQFYPIRYEELMATDANRCIFASHFPNTVSADEVFVRMTVEDFV